MKKIITLVLAIVLVLSSFGMVAQAKVGDVIETALHTDIVAYINHFAIPSYIVNGTSVVVAEDLRNYGFRVDWDSNARSLSISRDGTNVTPQFVGKGYATGAKYTDILETDIIVYADGQRITSYNMNGYTMIPMEELTMFGEVVWSQETRTLKLWVEGLTYLESPQPVSKQYYLETSAPDFGWITNSPCIYREGEYWLYSATAEDLQEYIDYIESVGYQYNMNKELDGFWSLGYINPQTRTGLALIEQDGMVQVQLATDVDYWQ